MSYFLRNKLILQAPTTSPLSTKNILSRVHVMRISELSLKLKPSQLNLIDNLKHTKNLTKSLICKYSADFNGFVLNLKREYLVLVSKSFNILTQITISKLDLHCNC